MQSEIPIPIETHALGTLAYIRRSIDTSGSLAVPGMAGVVMGCIGLLAALAASAPQWAPLWPLIWMLAGATAFLVGGALMARETALSGHARYLGPVRKFLLCLCPTLFAGAVLTAVLWHAGMVEPPAGHLAAALRLRGALGEHGDHPEHDAAHRHHGRALRGAGLPRLRLARADAHVDSGHRLRRPAHCLRHSRGTPGRAY